MKASGKQFSLKQLPLKKLGLTSLLRFGGVVLQTLVILFVGRVVGPAGVGALQVFLTWTCSLGESVAAGLPTHTMRQLANLESDTSSARVYLYTAWRRMALIWSGMGVLVLAAFGLGLEVQLEQVFLIGVSVFCFAFYRIASEGLKAFRDVDFSVLAESSMPPLVTGLMLMILYFFGFEMSVFAVLVTFTVGFVATSIVIFLRMMRRLEPKAVGATYLIRWGSHGPFWVSAIVSIVFLNFPFFVLPYFSSLEEVGAFALAFKLLNICTTILLLLGAIYGPKFSRYAKRQDFESAQKLLVLSRKISIFTFLPLGLLLSLLYPVIHPWFGEGFASGYQFLVILLIGQLFNAATGLSGQCLNMAGAGAIEMKIQLLSLLFALALTPALGSEFGAVGIAIVYSVTVAIRSVCSLWFASRVLSPQVQLAT